MKEFIELKLQAQRDSFGEKRRHFDLTAAGRINSTMDGLPHPLNGRFVHRQTKPNPYSRAQMLVMELDNGWHYPSGIPYSQLTSGSLITLEPKGESAVIAQVVRRWWEPLSRTDFSHLKPLPLKEGILLDFDFSFDADYEVDWLFLGSESRDMDDKWHVLGERPWVYWYRSWTGLPVFAARLDQRKIAEVYVFMISLREGVAPQSMGSSLQNLLTRTAKQARYVVDTLEARQILHRFGRYSG